MGLIDRMRKQKAVWWPKVGSDRSGQPIYDAPIEIACRWEDATVEFIDPAGRTVMSRAKVYVDRETPPGGVLWLGELGNLEWQTTPFKNSNAFEIKQFYKLPDIKARKFLLTAYI